MKKIISIILVSFLIIMAISCGAGNGEPKDTTSGGGFESTTPVECVPAEPVSSPTFPESSRLEAESIPNSSVPESNEATRPETFVSSSAENEATPPVSESSPVVSESGTINDMPVVSESKAETSAVESTSSGIIELPTVDF